MFSSCIYQVNLTAKAKKVISDAEVQLISWYYFKMPKQHNKVSR